MKRLKKAALELPDIAPLEPDPSVLINANGQKLEKSYGGGGIPTQTTRYHGGFQYVNNELQFFPTPEGYVQKSGNDYQYVYLYIDHLGNNRVSYADLNGNNSLEGTELLSSRDYDPFGGVIPDYGIENYVDSYASGFNYLYQGKELNEEGGLNWHDFGSRNYDATLGRWVVPDPANQFASPYLAMGNNPVLLTDPNGEFAIAAVAIGAAVGAIYGGVQANRNRGDVHDYVSGILGGAIVGALGGATSQVIPSSGGFFAGVINGFTGGFSSGYVGTIVGGGDFDQALQNGWKAGRTSGLISGVSSGISAAIDGRNFFNGLRWNEIYIGQGQNGNIGVEFEESLREWDVDERMSIPRVNQRGEFDCGIACKKSVDQYFGTTGQNSINAKWYRTAVSQGGLTNQDMFSLYRDGGYRATIYTGDFSKQNALKWIVARMKSDQVVQISSQVQNSTGYHATLIKRVRYLSDFSRFRISLMNPSSTIVNPRNFNTYQSMFSIWR